MYVLFSLLDQYAFLGYTLVSYFVRPWAKYGFYREKKTFFSLRGVKYSWTVWGREKEKGKVEKKQERR